MTNRILVLFSITIVSILSSTAQIPITSKNNWMYVDASFSYGDKSFPISAMIDTGCTYCVIDSTFAVDSCELRPRILIIMDITHREIELVFSTTQLLFYVWEVKSSQKASAPY